MRPRRSSHDPAPLGVAEDAVDGRTGRAGEGGDVLLDQGYRDRCSAAEDAGELEHPPRDAGLRADGVRLDEPLRQRRDALGEEPHEHLVDDACIRARRRSSEPRTTSVSPGSRAVTVALRSPSVITASSPNVSPGPRIPRATVSPSGVPMRTSKRPLATRCDRVGRVVAVEDDLACAGTCCGARARGRARTSSGGIPSNSRHSMCRKRYTARGAAVHDARPPPS